MPKVKTKYICKNCYEVHDDLTEGEFRNCNKCGIEVCIECVRWHKGKGYCSDCKPVETNYYDRSIE